MITAVETDEFWEGFSSALALVKQEIDNFLKERYTNPKDAIFDCRNVVTRYQKMAPDNETKRVG